MKEVSLSEFEFLKIIIMQNTTILAILEVMNANKLSPNEAIRNLVRKGDFRLLRDDIIKDRKK